MKRSITGLLKGGITRRNMLAAVLPAAGLSMAWTGHAGQQSNGNEVNRLGGTWIGADETGFLLNHVQIPLDPEGKTAALHVSILQYSQEAADFFSGFGADAMSDCIGPIKMISKDTAQGTLIAYGLASGPPPVIKVIDVVSLVFQFTAPDTMVSEYTQTFYHPSEDGLPHADQLWMGPFPAPTGTLKRVPLM